MEKKNVYGIVVNQQFMNILLHSWLDALRIDCIGRIFEEVLQPDKEKVIYHYNYRSISTVTLHPNTYC
jgi:hypothetical protein